MNVSETYIRECCIRLRSRQGTVQKELEHEHLMADNEQTRTNASLEEEYNNAAKAAKAEYDAKMKAAKTKYDNEKARAEVNMALAKQKASTSHGKELGSITGKLQWYESLKSEEKGRVFIKAICGDAEGNVGFWKFYEFMKTRL